MTIKKISINISNKELKSINKNILNYPWNTMPNLTGWKHGTNKTYLKKLCNYWVTKFNWKKFERKINKFSNFKTKVDDLNIHFIKEEGSATKPKPLLLMHGWPGSIIEFFDIIDQLAHPEKYGGKKEEGLTVIVPSLPGYGFSDASKKPIGPRKMAKILNRLMTKNLNYKYYIAQGGDWGATIANWLGVNHSNHCKAIHINCLTMRLPGGPKTKAEKKWQVKFNKDQTLQDGYRTQQSTKPQTLSYAMMDSPVGTAAWILEKIHGWSDLKNNDIESVYSKDVLLANIMVYVLTNTFNTASWIYFGRREEGGRLFPKNFKKIKIPTGIAIFPKEMSEWPPRSYVERIFNVVQWTKSKKGGHFAALEQPKLLINEIKKFTNKITL